MQTEDSAQTVPIDAPNAPYFLIKQKLTIIFTIAPQITDPI